MWGPKAKDMVSVGPPLILETDAKNVPIIPHASDIKVMSSLPVPNG